MLENMRSARWLNLLQTIAIIAGLVFGGIQVLQFRQEQRRQSEIDLAHSFMTPEFTEALWTVMALPDSLGWTDMSTRHNSEIGRVFLVDQTFETVGILVHQGDLDLPLVDDFLGTPIVTAWKKLGPSILEYRRLNNAPGTAEWFQWLAERLIDYRATAAPPPAYEAFRNWKPR